MQRIDLFLGLALIMFIAHLSCSDDKNEKTNGSDISIKPPDWSLASKDSGPPQADATPDVSVIKDQNQTTIVDSSKGDFPYLDSETSIKLDGAVIDLTKNDIASQKKTEIKIGYQPNTHQLAHITAIQYGWWQYNLQKFGITDVTDYSFATGGPEMDSMKSGELDIAYSGAAPFLIALAAGLDAKIIGAVQNQGSDLVLDSDASYKVPSDLKEARIATLPAGTIQDIVLRTWFKDNGMDPNKDVIIEPYQTAGDAVKAFTDNLVAGFFLPHPSPATIEANYLGKSVMKSGQMSPNHVCCVLIASGKFIKEHPEMVTQIVKTHIVATDWVVKNSQEAAQLFVDKTKGDIAVINKSIADWDGSWIADPNLIVDSVLSFAKIQYEGGTIKKSLSKEDIFDLSFYKKATE